MAAFAPGLKMSLFVAFFLPLLLWLGNWQLDRAAFKRQLQAEHTDRASQLPITAAAMEWDDAAANNFRRVRITGQFMPRRHFLVDNQVHEGKPGYWVVSAFTDTEHRLWLVNRGWLAAPPTRDQLPDVPTPAGVVQLVGAVWPFTGLVPLLREDAWAEPAVAVADGSSLVRVQRLDIDALIEVLAPTARVAVPMELRLEAQSTAVFVPAPQPIAGAAERHQGYALTWFGLAVALVVSFAVFGWRRGR